jgi:hypothetical protein
MSKDQTTEEPDAAKVARPVLKSGGRGDPFVDFNLLALRMWGVPGVALVGNRLRHENVFQLERFQRLYVALDPDAGGQKGTQALVSLLGSRVVPVKLPGDDDVGKLATLQDGKELFAAAMVTAAAGVPLADLELTQ